MRNLFIMHTQYNLILACGIAKNRFEKDENILILHAEFSLSEKLKENIEKCFDSVCYVQETFMPVESVFKEDYKLVKYLRKTKEIWKQKFDNIFLSQERMFDTYVLSKIAKHCKFKCYSVEEDVYFSVDNKRNNKTLKEPPKSILGKARQYVQYIFLGKNKYYRYCYFYGQSEIFDGNYVLFSYATRNELETHKLYEITKEELKHGIETLYGHISCQKAKTEKIIIFFFDLIERYRNPEAVKALVKIITKKCIDNNMTFVYKYHPRETQKIQFDSDENYIEIPAVVPAEKLLYDYDGKDVTVIGNLTTALWVSAKLDYKVFSIVKIENPDNEAAEKALTKMNIKLLNNSEEI